MTNELTALTEQAVILKSALDQLERDMEATKEKFQNITGQILKTLDLMEVDSYKASGYTFFKETKSSVKVPKTLEEKALLFDYLKEKGIFMETVSIHSGTLNTLYKNESNEAAEKGILDFRLPGVEEPTTYINLKMRKANNG